MNDIESIQKEYEVAKAKADDLEKKLAAAAVEKLKSLPGQVGLKNVDALIEALALHASPVMKGKLKSALAKESSLTPAKAGKRKKRVTLDDATKQEIKAALKAKNRTAAQIAKEYGCSVATVNNIKDAAGLTTKRKK